jgi:L-alanine-DL-glutamate epimerase-like enolase superfamily enzyme
MLGRPVPGRGGRDLEEESRMSVIASVDVWTVAFGEPSDHDRRRVRYGTLCRLRDRDGAVGWGEAVPIWQEAAHATTAMLRGWAPLVTGTPASPAAVARFVADHTAWYGTGGGAGFARSALDIAAWDLLARRAGLPMVELLGGLAHDSLPVHLVTNVGRADVTDHAAAYAPLVEETNAGGVKVGFGMSGQARLGFDHDRDVAFVAALRKAIGPGRKLMLDATHRVRWTPAEAIRRVRAFEEHGLHWIEECLGLDNIDGYAQLRAATSTLIAFGEHEWGTAGMARLLDTGTLDVLGIDPGRAGGITSFVQAARYADTRGRQVNSHAFAGPISYATGLACSLVSPNCHQFEIHPEPNTLMLALTPDLPRPTDGRVYPLSGPGLGVTIDESAIEAVTAE